MPAPIHFYCSLQCRRGWPDRNEKWTVWLKVHFFRFLLVYYWKQDTGNKFTSDRYLDRRRWKLDEKDWKGTTYWRWCFAEEKSSSYERQRVQKVKSCVNMQAFNLKALILIFLRNCSRVGVFQFYEFENPIWKFNLQLSLVKTFFNR